MSLNTALRCLVLLLTPLAAIGCGSDYPATVDVRGTVTLDGTPVPNALVTFMPTDGRRSGSGETDEDGRFSLTTFERGDGAVPGSHQVAVYPLDPPPMGGDNAGSTGSGNVDPRSYKAPFPEKYGLPKDSGFTAEVSPGGENDFQFDMKSGG